MYLNLGDAKMPEWKTQKSKFKRKKNLKSNRL